MGRGWHADVISFLSFDQSLELELSIIRPTRPVVYLEIALISLYLFPYNRFRKRMRSRKSQGLNCVSAALDGNLRALDHSLLKDELSPSKIDLLYYQDRIRSIKEWPFTDRIRALVLFGILPPLTWVVAALIEIYIESAL